MRRASGWMLGGILSLLVVVGCGTGTDEASARLGQSSASTTCDDGYVPGPGPCWLTGGGTFSGESGGVAFKYSFGGNVYPSCGTAPGRGGSWTQIDHLYGIHFHGTDITVDECGNFSPPGSTSPRTDYNYIKFSGTGWMMDASKVRYDVCFRAMAEDHNEPGSRGAKDVNLVDRYFLQIFAMEDCDAMDAATPLTSVGWVSESESDGEWIDVPITTGNLQIHATSCP